MSTVRPKLANIIALVSMSAGVVVCAKSSAADPAFNRVSVYKYDVNGTTHYSSRKPSIGSFSTLLTLVTTPQGVVWTSLGFATDNSEVLIDAKSKKKAGQKVKAWVLTNYQKTVVLPGTSTSLRSRLDLWNVDCSTDEVFQSEWIAYTDQFGSGEVVGTWKLFPSSYTVPPGSFGERIRDSACAEPAKKEPSQ